MDLENNSKLLKESNDKMNQLKNENQKLIDNIYNLWTDYNEIYDQASIDYNNCFYYKEKINEIKVIDSDLYDFIFQSTDTNPYMYKLVINIVQYYEMYLCRMLNNEREKHPLTLGQMFEKLSLLWDSDSKNCSDSCEFKKKDMDYYFVFIQFLVTFHNNFIHYHESDKVVIRLDDCLNRIEYIKEIHDIIKVDDWFINCPITFNATLNELQFPNRKIEPRNFYQNNSKRLKPVSVQQKNTK